jgi:hypothetical protein
MYIPVFRCGWRGTLTAPKAPGGLSVLPAVLTFNIPNGSTAPVTQSLVVNNEGLDAESYQVAVATVSGGNTTAIKTNDFPSFLCSETRIFRQHFLR